MTLALYNEIEPFAADWLEKLVEAGHVAPGRVERRSVRELAPKDLDGATQAHFFAGIGGWSYALRLAGWPDDLPVWTGSCPCQPFSVAGKRKGKTDDRHLWPVWFALIRECRPAVVLGEQVASPDGLDWLDSVSADLEGAGYAFAATDLCAAGVGAPHARQRLYFVAYAHGRPGDLHASRRREGSGVPHASRSRSALGVADAEVVRRGGGVAEPSGRSPLEPDGRLAPRSVADTDSRARRQGREDERGSDPRGDAESRTGPGGHGVLGLVADAAGERAVIGGPAEPSRDGSQERVSRSDRASGGLGDTSGSRARRHTEAAAAAQTTGPGARGEPRSLGDGALAPSAARAPSGSFPGAARGFWEDAEWIYCTDRKWRPVEPGSFPLAHGVPGRMGCLRGYGNAIVPPQAALFVTAVREAMEGVRA